MPTVGWDDTNLAEKVMVSFRRCFMSRKIGMMLPEMVQVFFKGSLVLGRGAHRDRGIALLM